MIKQKDELFPLQTENLSFKRVYQNLKDTREDKTLLKAFCIG